jgi:hypothetical protein
MRSGWFSMAAFGQGVSAACGGLQVCAAAVPGEDHHGCDKYISSDAVATGAFEEKDGYKSRQHSQGSSADMKH